MRIEKEVLKSGCPKCGHKIVNVHYIDGTSIVQMRLCDSCGVDVR